MIRGRLGLDVRKLTLEEIGQIENVTRERIRQIEAKLMAIIEKPKMINQLSYLWLILDNVLQSRCGVCCVRELADILIECCSWTTNPTDEALAALISVNAKYKIVWTPPIRIIMPNHLCVNCIEIGPILTESIVNQESGSLFCQEAFAIMAAFCQQRNCVAISEYLNFSKGYLYFIADAIEEILVDEDTLYTQYAWAQKYGGSRLMLYETILRSAGRPMHFTEVHAEVNKDRPNQNQLSERSVYGNLERSPSLILWGPGTFFHKDFITIPEMLISQIENDIISRLYTDNIPYLSITGIFENYKSLLLENNVPSAQALYSCLRFKNNSEVITDDYPYVLSLKSNGIRLPPPLVLEEYILEHGGIVTLDNIREFATKKLCVNEEVFQVNHLPNIPNLLRVDRGQYVHLSKIAIKVEDIDPIMDHLHNIISTSDHVSVAKLYNEKKISCKLLGIKTPRLLFSIIQMFHSDEFDLTIYPKICIAGHLKSNNLRCGVTSG